jgi:membrane protease YdiL (CAAX protease family)
MKHRGYFPVVLFFVLAVAISGPFFYWRTILDWKGFQGPPILKTLSYMWGPGIAGIICHLLYRKHYTKEITITGRSPLQSLLIWVGPLLLLTALGIPGKNGTTDHTTPLLLIGMGFLTIWGEEFGWRWFLQDYLSPLKPWKKYLLIGVLWELWHLRFLSKLGQPLPAIILSSLLVLVVTVLIAFLIGFITDRTRSLAFAAALHAWIDLCFEWSNLNTYICAIATLALAIFFALRAGRREAALIPAPLSNLK